MGIMKEKFRPSARLISTIGENLIKDNYAAVVELVKNSYDADATNVNITFEFKSNSLYISIEDDGIGMSPDTIVNKWLVPSTDDKLIRKVSEKGRIMQGQKGIGRFSAAILGEFLELVTRNNGIESRLKINWNDFNNYDYLDEIDVELETTDTTKKSGTIFIIKCSDRTKFWTEENIQYLEKELRKTLTPLKKEDEFKINLIFRNFYIDKYNDTVINIEPLPLLNYYNYRIYGTVDNLGKAEIKFEYRSNGILIKDSAENLKIDINANYKYCGNIEFDFRVFEREKDNLVQFYENEAYISTSLNSMKLNEVKRLLDKVCGIGIYKNDFRIRPYGDEGYDWLELDKQRVQNPSYKIGFNQISGMIKIESEEKSGLVEKSARDGIREDAHFNGFKMIINRIIDILEAKRANLRKNNNEEINSNKLEKIIENESLKEKLSSVVKQAGIEKDVASKLEKIVDEDEKEKHEKIRELTTNISKYEGQATLGKIVDLIMHEIRKPLMWFKTQSVTISKAYDRYKINHDENDLEKIVRIIESSETEASLISDFFKKIDILATRSSNEKEMFNVYNVINDTLNIFVQKFADENIEYSINCDKDIQFYGWKKDIVVALSNIIENSIYWISNFETKENKITIDVQNKKGELIITIFDTGIGFDSEFLKNDLLFKPGVSSKKNGTGIGLAIVGNCISRNNGNVEAFNNGKGACIKITLPKKEG